MKYLKLCLLLAIMISFSSCSDDDEAPLMEPAERIVGTWTVQSVTALTITVPDGESTVTFEKCGANDCAGSSYESLDETSDNFTYVLNTDGTAVAIDAEGLSSFDGEWTVTDFTNNTLKLTQETILGDVVYNLSK